MGRLAQAGLEEIRFSTGNFHSRYVPVKELETELVPVFVPV